MARKQVKLTKKPQTENRKIKNAQKLVVDGKSFRSKLEVYCYQKLKENNIEFEYESTKFCLLPDFKYGGESAESYSKGGKWSFGDKSNSIKGVTYKPDFLNLSDGWLIECKGYPNDAFPLRWKLFKYLLSTTGLTLDLYLPKNQGHIDLCIERIKNKLISTGVLNER
jgi:hypothetical protein